MVDGQTFRRTLGHYPTGVCAITAMGDGGPVGLIVGSFSSVSLDPPLVCFLPDRRSTSWPKVRATGRFCVNVLAEGQTSACRQLSSREADKFDALAYRLSPAGLPILDGVLAWVECRLVAVHEAGDHFIVVGEVDALDVENVGRPLLFFQGGYGSFLAAPADPGPPA